MSPLTRESLERLDAGEPDLLVDRINRALNPSSLWTGRTPPDSGLPPSVAGVGSSAGPSAPGGARGSGTAVAGSSTAPAIGAIGAIGGRRRSVTPSTTSVSDDDGEDDDKLDDGRAAANAAVVAVAASDVKEWVDERGAREGREGREESGSAASGGGTGSGVGFEDLPMEILLRIFGNLTRPSDLASAALVSRSSCLAAYPLLWHRPTFTSLDHFTSFVRSVSNPSPTLPWALAVRRLILTPVAPVLSDEHVLGLTRCTRLERLVLSSATRVSPDALKSLLKSLPGLVGLDLSHIGTLHHSVIPVAAEAGGKLQGINLIGCKQVNDEGVTALARYCILLRRIKLAKCLLITDVSMTRLARSCPYLLELDLVDVDLITDLSLFFIFSNLSHLRELKMNHNKNITDAGFPLLARISEMTDEEVMGAEGEGEFPAGYVESVKAVAEWQKEVRVSQSQDQRTDRRMDVDGAEETNQPQLASLLRPVTTSFDHLRLVDFTSCSSINDAAIDKLTRLAPKLRSLTLAKCPLLTDAIAESIGRLGRYLHYLHLGHVSRLSDAGVARIVQSCSRLRYLDVACCSNLTDLSVFEIASNLTKVRRIGLVKVTKITDEALYALNDRWDTLERLHLSYCNNITVDAVTFMLNRMAFLTHLSLTGVSSFKKPELQQFCRPPPSEFNEHQQASFCVFSGHGIKSLRTYLNSRAAARVASDGTSTGRESTSSLSSITAPGGNNNGGNRSPSPSSTMLPPGLHRVSLPNLSSRAQRRLFPDDEMTASSSSGQSTAGGGGMGIGTAMASTDDVGLRQRSSGQIGGGGGVYSTASNHQRGHSAASAVPSVRVTNAWFPVPQQYPATPSRRAGSTSGPSGLGAAGAAGAVVQPGSGGPISATGWEAGHGAGWRAPDARQSQHQHPHHQHHHHHQAQHQHQAQLQQPQQIRGQTSFRPAPGSDDDPDSVTGSGSQRSQSTVTPHGSRGYASPSPAAGLGAQQYGLGGGSAGFGAGLGGGDGRGAGTGVGVGVWEGRRHPDTQAWGRIHEDGRGYYRWEGAGGSGAVGGTGGTSGTGGAGGTGGASGAGGNGLVGDGQPGRRAEGERSQEPDGNGRGNGWFGKQWMW